MRTVQNSFRSFARGASPSPVDLLSFRFRSADENRDKTNKTIKGEHLNSFLNMLYH